MSAARVEAAAGARRRERGSAALEAAILVPALVLLLAFAALAGRVVQAHQDVVGAAADAARAASLRRSPDAAERAARRTARRVLARRGTACDRLAVSVDTGGLRPGGAVSVRVRCTADLGDLGVPGLPGARTLGADASEVVDRYRGS